MWKGLIVLIRRLLGDGSLARDFPGRNCPDGDAITGTDEVAFFDSLDAHIPDLPEHPLDTLSAVDTTMALDIVDFVMRHIDQPTRRTWHDFSRHMHYFFDEPMGFDAGGSSLNLGQEQFAGTWNFSSPGTGSRSRSATTGSSFGWDLSRHAPWHPSFSRIPGT
ncbi:hypothetical protein NQK81_02470 [Amycolatopsis roodepoortensis]|uniref:hypothetical protein n=1 Tax=Amycolatopsis roodepoortensis TaxID=700274 RepID=UPI00214B700B|nr:hypothetical protein [Amycolatopsis roodepoortensis]UUV32338.1 hypothetical protein NQK81_02470 [Amycolatopsis roodepoortensis]